MKKLLFLSQGVIQLLVGLGAVVSGAIMLNGSPFHDFLLPGIILFLVNGVGLMIWIFVQVNMMGGGHVLQYSYFAVGVIETVLSFLIQEQLWIARERIRR